MVGLLFVAATVGAGIFGGARRAASRVFLSASVIHFTSLLVACLIVLVPRLTWLTLGGLILASGIFGLGYYGLTWRDMVRDGLLGKIDLDDRIRYAALPVVAYLVESASGVALMLRSDWDARRWRFRWACCW